MLDGRKCLVLALIAKREAPYLIEGSLWVDSKDGSIVQVQGTTSKSSSLMTGPTQIVRQYENIRGYSQATHVRAVTKSVMFGKAIVTIATTISSTGLCQSDYPDPGDCTSTSIHRC